MAAGVNGVKAEPQDTKDSDTLAVLANINGPLTNGHNGVQSHSEDGVDASIEDLERELPQVDDGQIPLGDLLSRVTQAIYAELSELAETLPNMSDGARKRTLADWVVKIKKQIVKLYAITKWSRDAETVQKCMNITAFLMNQNQQFEDAIYRLKYARDSLDPARLRNHDLLTSLDVLTTGSYLRLPNSIKKTIISDPPLTDEEVIATLLGMDDVLRYRLRVNEIVPVEMTCYRIENGRVYFHVPHLFETSLCLRGADKDDGWFFVHIEFLMSIGGDLTDTQEFPRVPKSILKRHIADEADARLAFYLPLPPDPFRPTNVEVPPRPQLPPDVVDAPLIRLYNFLQMMSMAYQLEILWYQAVRMRSLGWADFLKVEMVNHRKTLIVTYWVRPSPPSGRTQAPNRPRLPPQGGTLTISLVQTHAPTQVGGGPARSPKARILADVQKRAKAGSQKLSDEVETLRFHVIWEPTKGALGVIASEQDTSLDLEGLRVNPDSLDLEHILRKVIEKHTLAVLSIFQYQLQHGPTRTMFAPPGEVILLMDHGAHALRVHLCGDEIVIITIDPRTGRLTLRDTGDLASVGRGPRFSAISERVNENPLLLIPALGTLRLTTITDIAEQKAIYLGLRIFRQRNFSEEELMKLGAARGRLFIQLSNFPSHYLVLNITDEDFRYALISVRVLPDSTYTNMVMEDIAWLDIRRICGVDISMGASASQAPDVKLGTEEIGFPTAGRMLQSSFDLETRVLRELYAYCCARVAYTKVEQQFKLRGIPYTHVNPMGGAVIPPELVHIQSSLARSVPALCVQSSDILSGAPAAEAAMPNIRVIPLNWWSDKRGQVVTCVKLKYVQQPLGKRAGTTSVIRPSKRIIYDTTEAVVSFLSEDVNTCVDEFLEEWARVSKMVVIAREVAQMAKDKLYSDVRLLSFDLQTVEFAYAADYTVSITCTDQLSPTGGSFDLRFSRQSVLPSSAPASTSVALANSEDLFNPHDDAEPFLRSIMRHGRLGPSVRRLVAVLRQTLPIVVTLEEIRVDESRKDGNVDTFVKAAGWYRLLYGDLRHALDFRIMTRNRVAVLDASYSLFNGHPSDKPSSYDQNAQNSQHSNTSKGTKSPSTSTSTLPSSSSSIDLHVLQPIPSFSSLISDALSSLRHPLPSSSSPLPPPVSAVSVDVGVVCDAHVVGRVAAALHGRVLKIVKEQEKQSVQSYAHPTPQPRPQLQRQQQHQAPGRPLK